LSAAVIGFFFIFSLISFGAVLYLSPGHAFGQSDPETTEAVPRDNWTSYTNNEKGISFDYPSDWEVEEKQDRFDRLLYQKNASLTAAERF
jgi:hypothetical protein